MKKIILFILIASVFYGCSKNSDVTPSTVKQTAKDTTTLKPDVLIRTVVFNAGAQIVKTSVSDTTLKMVFNENINLYVTAMGFNQTYAVHLFENFQNSNLSGLDFTTVNADGNTTFDWVDDNLNNVTTKTISDTTVNGVAIKKINVVRPFTFTKAYHSNDAALSAQKLLLTKTNDYVTFSSYCYYTGVNYPTTGVNVTMLYTK